MIFSWLAYFKFLLLNSILIVYLIPCIFSFVTITILLMHMPPFRKYLDTDFISLNVELRWIDSIKSSMKRVVNLFLGILPSSHFLKKLVKTCMHGSIVWFCWVWKEVLFWNKQNIPEETKWKLTQLNKSNMSMLI